MELTPEELARIEAGVSEDAEEVHEAAPNVPEEVEDVANEVEDLSEQLALQSIISDEKHEEILECLDKLEKSSTSENPSLAAIHKELLEIRSELVNLKSSLATNHTNRPRNESEHQESSSPNLESQIEEPKPLETPELETPTPPARKRARFI